MTGAENPISMSIAPAMRAIGKRYDDLPGILELMRRLWQEAVLDGFEFQNLAEWDAAGPPRDEAAKRLAEAAAIIQEYPIALQLRYLQTLQVVAAENNSTTLFPIPIDLLEAFMQKITGPASGRKTKKD